MKLLYSILVLGFIQLYSFGQTIKTICLLSDEVSESSGIIYLDGFYTLNDSGGEPILYKLDTLNGNVIEEVKINGAKNKDWESLTQDEQFIYIADLGNNHGTRKDLVVYKCDKSSLGDHYLQAEEIKISYSDQDSYKKRTHDHKFDCEAIFTMNNELFVLTKNWNKKETTIYQVPKELGNYELKPIRSFDTEGKVTDAYFDKASRSLVMIGYGDDPFLTIIRGFTILEPSPNWETIIIDSPNSIQTEGVTVKNSRIYFTSERIGGSKSYQSGELGSVSMNEVQKHIELENKKKHLKISCDSELKKITVYDIEGKKIKKFENEGAKFKLPYETINTKQFVVKIKTNSGFEMSRLIVL